MKILITVSTYYPKNDGVQNVTQYLAEGLCKLGNDVTVITSNRGEKIKEECHNGVKIKRINLYTKFGFYFGNKKEYKKVIKDEANKCDVMINVCTQNAFTDVILKKIGSYNCKKILYMHGMFDFKFSCVDFSNLESFINKIWKEFRWFVYYLINGRNFRKYDNIIQLHEKDYANIFFRKKYNINSKIINNAASEEFFNLKCDQNFSKPFNKYIIQVANYSNVKNQKIAIREFLKSNIDENIGLVLIGSQKNKYYSNLEKYIKRIRKVRHLNDNIKPIKMLYGIERKEIVKYISNAELYIMTSKKEVYPMSLVETMSVGVPYLSTDVGIVRYFLGGIISKEKDFHYWIKEILTNENMRECLSKLSLIYAKKHFKIEDKIEILSKICK